MPPTPPGIDGWEDNRNVGRIEEVLNQLYPVGPRNHKVQDVLDSAHSLNGACYGVIALHAGYGTAEDLVFSGITADEVVVELTGFETEYNNMAV